MRSITHFIFQKIKTTNMWLLLVITVIASEIFTALMNALLGLLWWGSVSYDLLKIGTIDAFVVPSLVAPLLLSMVRLTDRMLQDSEQKYRALMKDAGEAILLTDLKGRFIEVNRRAEELTGYAKSELAAMDISKLHPPDEVDKVLRLFGEAVARGGAVINDVHLLRKDAAKVPVEITDTIIDYGGKKISQAIIRDVTESRKAEAELRRHRHHLEELIDERTAELQGSERRYHSLFENMLDGFSYCRMLYEEGRPQDFVYLDVNPSFERLTGLKNVTGKKVSEVIPGIREAHPGLFEVYGRVALTGRPERFEMYVDALGRWFTTSVYSPEKEHFVAVFDNITERKWAEETVQKSEERFRLIAETIEEVFWMADVNLQRMLYISPAYERIWGRTRQNLYENPRSLLDAVHRDDLKRVLAVLELQKDGQPFDHQYRIIRPDGAIRWIWDRGYPVPDETGQITRFVGVAQDITGQKVHEREIERLSGLYASLSQINQSIVRVRSREELFQDICRIAVEYAGFKVAWIGLPDPETHEVRAAARAGEDGGYLDKITVSADDRAEGRGPIGVCIREGRPCIFNDFQADPRALPWREAALAHGIRSVGAFPIRFQGAVLGAFTVYSGEPDVFQDKEVALLEEAALDISFALDNLETEARRKRAQEALQASEERYRNTLDSMMEGCQLIGYDGTYLYVNDAAARHGQKTRDELLGRRVVDVYPGIEHTGMYAALRRCMDSRTTHQMENEFVYHDGSSRWFELIMQPVQEGLFILSQDITERSHAEAVLRESEARYRGLFENMVEGYAYCRMIFENGEPTDFIYLAVNGSFETLTGLKNVVGKRVSEAIPGIRDADPRLFEIYGRVSLTGTPERFEMFVEALQMWFSISVYCPQPEHFVAVFDVITGRKRAEQERERTIEFLRLVNESTGTRDLIKAATTFFQQQSGCEAVGIRLHDGGDYPYFEARGFPEEFVLAESSLCARDSSKSMIRDSEGNPVLECMCGNVICGRFNPSKPFFTEHGSFWSNNTTELLRSTTEADRQARTRNRCNGEGYESVALLPLRLGDQRLGLLQLNDRRTGVFSRETISSWERLADQLAVALAKFRTEDALRESESRFSTVFHSSPIGIVISRLSDGTIYDANDTFLSVYGFDRQEVIGHSSIELQQWVNVEDRAAMVNMLRDRGRVQNLEAKFRRKTGETGDLLISAERIELAGEECLLGMFSDITDRKRLESALREGEERFRLAMDATEDGLWDWDVSGERVYYSPGYFRMLGYEAGELPAKLDTWLELVHPEDRERALSANEACIRNESPAFSVEFRMRSRDGTWRWILGRGKAVRRGPDGHALQMVGTHIDITARKRAEEELRSSAQMWNNTFDAIHDAVSIMDQNGTIQRCNKEMIELLDRYPQEIVSHPCWEVIHGADERIDDCPFRKMLRSRRRETSVQQMLGRWFSVTADPIIDQAGRLVGGVHIMTDVTEHKLFEEQLKESENKFRSLTEQSLVGTYIIQDNTFKYVSPRLAEMFAYEAEELIDKKGPLDLVLPEDHHFVEKNIQKRLSGQAPFSHYEVRGLKKGGEVFSIEIFGSATSFQGRPAVIGVTLDISEKKKLEDQLRQAQKMEAVGQLTGGIAHDFNNILSAIVGYASLLLMRMQENDPGRPFVDQILAGTDRAASLTRSLLTFSRKQITSLAPIDINENIRRVEKLLQRIIGEDIDLRTALAPGPVIVNADSGQIEQVLMNLATNARDAMQQGGLLSLETTVVGSDALGEEARNGKDSKYVVLSVADTGAGMDEKTREKIFEPFFTTKDLGRGTGLGLSMVYGIIKQHGGLIHCYSEPRMGTTFKIYLPLLATAGEARVEKVSRPLAGESLRGNETILVAEDDEVMRALVKATLSEFGYTVITAVDGKDALERFLENRDSIRLVLCDVIMPRMNGGEVMDAVRKMMPGMRILFMSGYPADIIKQKGLLGDGAEMILKPLAPSELLKKVRGALDRNPREQAG